MTIRNDHHRAVIEALEYKYGTKIKIYTAGHQTFATLPNGEDAPIKSGSKGNILQVTRGEEYDAPYTGAQQTAETIIIAVRNDENSPFKIYEVPGEEYRSKMKERYIKRTENHKLNKTTLRVLRFNDKGYPEQRIAEEWEEYRIDVENRDNAKQENSNEMHNLEEDGETLHDVLVRAKKLFASISGVSESDVEISIKIST